MISLEFIEKEIKNSKEFLDRAIRYNLPICIKNEKEKLHNLQQIKSVLEAWEVVKNKGVDMFIFMLYYNNLEEYNNYIKSLEGECDYEKLLLTQEEANSIKKALEVEDE